MERLTLYRKRLIPEECILLKDDIILSADKDRIITSWNTLRPKKDLHHGYSMYLLKEGIKVSKFLREDGSLLYWYCDIVTYSWESDNEIADCHSMKTGDCIVRQQDICDNANYILTSVDLLADVIVYPDGFVKVVDLDELVQALNEKKISDTLLTDSLLKLNKLLSLIYAGSFSTLTEQIEAYITEPMDQG